MNTDYPLKKCPYCGGIGILSNNEGYNIIGTAGYITVIRCSGCYRHIEIFDKNANKSIEECINKWNGH